MRIRSNLSFLKSRNAGQNTISLFIVGTKKFVKQGLGYLIEAYTDILLYVIPIIRPNQENHQKGFLFACQILFPIIELFESVFGKHSPFSKRRSSVTKVEEAKWNSKSPNKSINELIRHDQWPCKGFLTDSAYFSEVEEIARIKEDYDFMEGISDDESFIKDVYDQLDQLHGALTAFEDHSSQTYEEEFFDDSVMISSPDFEEQNNLVALSLPVNTDNSRKRNLDENLYQLTFCN